MTKINQTLVDPEVPRGGTIREILGWEGTSPSGVTHTFYLLSFYGVGTTIEEILANVVAYNYITGDIVGPGQSVQSNIDTPIEEGAPLGTFSCATIIAEGFDGSTINGIYDAQIDANVLTITAGLNATIISTSFSSI